MGIEDSLFNILVQYSLLPSLNRIPDLRICPVPIKSPRKAKFDEASIFSCKWLFTLTQPIWFPFIELWLQRVILIARKLEIDRNKEPEGRQSTYKSGQSRLGVHTFACCFESSHKIPNDSLVCLYKFVTAGALAITLLQLRTYSSFARERSAWTISDLMPMYFWLQWWGWEIYQRALCCSIHRRSSVWCQVH